MVLNQAGRGMEQGHWTWASSPGRDGIMMTACSICSSLFAAVAIILITHYSSSVFSKKNAQQSSGRADSFGDYFEKAAHEVAFDSVFISVDARRRQGLPDGPRDCGCRVLLQRLAQPAVLVGLPSIATRKSYPNLTWPRLMLPRKASPKGNSQQPG
jgi:hypothetical protein